LTEHAWQVWKEGEPKWEDKNFNGTCELERPAGSEFPERIAIFALAIRLPFLGICIFSKRNNPVAAERSYPTAAAKNAAVAKALNPGTEPRTVKTEIATFAGGCSGVPSRTLENSGSGEGHLRLHGGKKENPSYGEVSAGTTGHVEASRSIMTRQDLLWRTARYFLAAY